VALSFYFSRTVCAQHGVLLSSLVTFPFGWTLWVVF
jgi:hypothetical protein